MDDFFPLWYSSPGHTAVLLLPLFFPSNKHLWVPYYLLALSSKSFPSRREKSQGYLLKKCNPHNNSARQEIQGGACPRPPSWEVAVMGFYPDHMSGKRVKTEPGFARFTLNKMKLSP